MTSKLNSPVSLHIRTLHHIFTAETAVELGDSHSQWQKTCPNKEYEEAREAEAVPIKQEESSLNNPS